MENEEIESQQNTDDLAKKRDFDYYRQLFHDPCTCGGTYSTTHEMPKYLTGQEKRRERRAKERELKRKKI